MKIIEKLEDLPKEESSTFLTFGNFDGFHLGHQKLLKELKQEAELKKGKKVVITFQNHPSYFLRPQNPVKPLFPLNDKLDLLKKEGIDLTLVLPFDRNLARLKAESFLQLLSKYFPFAHLFLGDDATFGSDQLSNHEITKKLAGKAGISLRYVDKLTQNGIVVSSTLIRQFVKSGNFSEAEKLLSRKFFLRGQVDRIEKIDKSKLRVFLTFPKLTLPPPGRYEIQLSMSSKKMISGKASLFPSRKGFIDLKAAEIPPGFLKKKPKLLIDRFSNLIDSYECI